MWTPSKTSRPSSLLDERELPVSTRRAIPRGTAKRNRAARRAQDLRQVQRALVADERGTIVRDAPLRVALAYPNPYHTAMSSLGYQVVYRAMNARPGVAAERFVLPDDPDAFARRGVVPLSLESERPLGAFDLVAFSVAYDLDIAGFFSLLTAGGVPPLRADRGPHDPPVLLGGPLTASNPLPFGPFIDLAVIGDGEEAVESLLDILEDARDRDDLLRRAAQLPGVWVPELHGDRVPPTQKVAGAHIPAFGQIITPHAELSNMFLVEASRGCRRYCRFCLVRAPESPMRSAELDAVLDKIPADAPRVGFVGAAVSEWPGLRQALGRVLDRGQGVGVSSLRADVLDDELVGLLARGGYRTMTVASDAASQRLRGKLAKGIRARHLVEAARLAARHGMKRVKLYVVLGLPGETDEDLDELVELARELSSHLPLAIGASPLVPKLHTPLGDAPFAGVAAIERTLKRLRRALGGVADLRATSGRWAWVEYRMSQGGEDVGLAAYRAWQDGGTYQAWRRALATLPPEAERAGLTAARAHGLWPAAGMK